MSKKMDVVYWEYEIAKNIQTQAERFASLADLHLA